MRTLKWVEKKILCKKASKGLNKKKKKKSMKIKVHLKEHKKQHTHVDKKNTKEGPKPLHTLRISQKENNTVLNYCGRHLNPKNIGYQM